MNQILQIHDGEFKGMFVIKIIPVKRGEF